MLLYPWGDFLIEFVCTHLKSICIFIVVLFKSCCVYLVKMHCMIWHMLLLFFSTMGSMDRWRNKCRKCDSCLLDGTPRRVLYVKKERGKELLLWFFENITNLKCWTFCKLFFSWDFPLHLNVVLFTVIILNSNTVVAALHRTLREHLSSRSSASWSVRESTFCNWKRYSRRHSRLESMLGEREGRKWVCCLKLRTK